MSDWTVDSLRIHIEAVLDERDRHHDSRFKAQHDAMAAALESSQVAVAKADAANERRFESVNEFRQVLSDQAGTFISRAEYMGMHTGLEEKVNGAMARLDVYAGRSRGISDSMGAIIGLAGLAIAGLTLAAMFIKG